ncbi:MAG: hypothetical protein ACRDT6_28985 [Micromonosporaceae bacterium]
MEWLFNAAINWLAAGLLAVLDVLITFIGEALLISPDVTWLPQVKALTGRSVWVVDTVFVLAFIAAGAVTMFSDDERRQYQVRELAPRLVVGFLAAHFSTLVSSKAIGLANGAAQALGPHSKVGETISGKLREPFTGTLSDQPAALLLLVMLTLVVALLAATILGMVARLAALLVLTSIAPLALACHALPNTDPVARLWWRCFGGCLAIPVLQAFTLQAGHWMLTDPEHLLAPLRLPVVGDPFTVLNLFVVVVLLATTARIPGLVRRHVTQTGGRGSNVLGAVIRVVVVQQLARAVPGLRSVVKAVRR